MEIVGRLLLTDFLEAVKQTMYADISVKQDVKKTGNLQHLLVQFPFNTSSLVPDGRVTSLV
jgi:hypothetical protein